MATIYSNKLKLASANGANTYEQTVSLTDVKHVSTLPFVVTAPNFKVTNSTTGNIVTDVVTDFKAKQATMAINMSTGLYLMATETATRLAADTANDALLAEEVTSRQAQGTQLSNDITASSTSRATLLSAETAFRVAAVADAQLLLDAEIADRAAGDAVIDAKITLDSNTSVALLLAEISARIAGDFSNQSVLDTKYSQINGLIATETEELAAAKVALETQVNVEVVAREAAVAVQKARVDAVFTSLNVDEAKLVETVAAYTAVDVSIQNQIANVTSQISAYNNNFNLLKTKVDNALTSA